MWQAPGDARRNWYRSKQWQEWPWDLPATPVYMVDAVNSNRVAAMAVRHPNYKWDCARSVLLQFLDQRIRTLAPIEIRQPLFFRRRGKRLAQQFLIDALPVGHPDPAVFKLHFAHETGHRLDVQRFAAARETQRRVLLYFRRLARREVKIRRRRRQRCRQVFLPTRIAHQPSQLHMLHRLV